MSMANFKIKRVATIATLTFTILLVSKHRQIKVLSILEINS